MIKYQIWSNVAARPERFLLGYEPTDAMFLSHEGELPEPNPEQVPPLAPRITERTLDHLFNLFNADERPNGQVAHSLSLGDVVVLNGAAYAVSFVGWRAVPNWDPVVAQSYTEGQ